MSSLISKLQYKNYEKGEYTDEQARNLNDTLQLIKTFPWDSQRGTDVQLTGPSVTILDDEGNYLKAGLYFGGKFCLYYFTADHRLYECHGGSIDEIVSVVTAFFESGIDLQKFERTHLVLDAAKHFENAEFEYRIKSWILYGRLILLIFLALLLLGDACIIVFVQAPLTVKLLLPAFVLFLISLSGYQQYRAMQYYSRCKNMLLQLSAGRDTFSLGEDGYLTEYSKSNISTINIYGALAGRSTPVLTLCELIFTNGTVIKLPGMLIPPMDVKRKFWGVETNLFDKRKDYTKEQTAFARGE